MSLLPADFPQTATSEDLARLLSITPEAIRRLSGIPGAVPPAFRIGTGPRARLRFRRADVEAWLADQLAPKEKGDQKAA